MPVSPLMYIAGIRLQKEVQTAKTKPIRSVAMTMPIEKTPQETKIRESLSKFLGIPVSSISEAVSSCSAAMHISHNDSHQTQITFMLPFENVEIGPRITLSHVVWEIEK